MNSGLLSMGVMASATMLTATVVAGERINDRAAAPAPATAELVANFVERYTASKGLTPAGAMSNATGGRAQNLVLYPTADGEVVFMTFDTDGVISQTHNIALITVRNGRVTQFTDFTGAKPKNIAPVTVGRAAEILRPEIDHAGDFVAHGR